MRVIWLAWYICGVCLLLALLASAITYHPTSSIWAWCCRPRSVAWHSGGGRRSAWAVAADAPRPPVKPLWAARRGRRHRDAVAGPGG